jgi:hypothetical protein
MCAIHSAFSVGVAAKTAKDFFGEITCHPFFQAEERGRGRGRGREGRREREGGRERERERGEGERVIERERENSEFVYIVHTRP